MKRIAKKLLFVLVGILCMTISLPLIYWMFDLGEIIKPLHFAGISYCVWIVINTAIWVLKSLNNIDEESYLIIEDTAPVCPICGCDDCTPLSKY